MMGIPLFVYGTAFTAFGIMLTMLGITLSVCGTAITACGIVLTMLGIPLPVCGTAFTAIIHPKAVSYWSSTCK